MTTVQHTSGDLLAEARRLVPLVEANAVASEQGRRLAAPVVEAFREAGLFRLCVPAAYAGPEVDPLTMSEIIQTVAAADGAAGWCVMIASTTSSMSMFLPPDTARAIYGDPAVITGGAYAPNGTGTRTDAGWSVTGRWQWGSGTQHCDWITGGSITDDGGFHLCFLPKSAVTFHDTWDSSGLRGTGSLDFSVDGVVVPFDRTVQPGVGRPTIDGPLARFPNFNLLATGVASATLGIARRALDEVTALAQGKRPLFSAKTLADSSVAQSDLAQAEAAHGAARAFLAHEVGVAWDQACRGERVSTDQRARVRLACAHTARAAARAVDVAYELGGGSSVYATNPLQRCFRDVHTATQHLMVSPRMFETIGKVLLGRKADLTTL
jgi:alkylation response protein AidB-like acyl-CoA dehydrogenase